MTQQPDLKSNRLFKLTDSEQMANIGSEIERALKWRNKGNTPYVQLANYRALELFDLSLDDPRSGAQIKAFTRARE